MFYRPNTKTVGWLALGHEFPTTAPSNELLDALWAYCKVSVAQMRGIHECEFCPGEDVHNAERNGELLLLGTSEIRVFSETGEIFAAPTLIYHYVRLHQYAPPAVFVRAVLAGPAPPDPEYFARLSQVGLDWNATSRFAGPRRRLGQPVPGGS
jgi:hypothetical protein